MDEVNVTRNRIILITISSLTVASLVLTAILGWRSDRADCRAAAQAISNSRTMWEYLIAEYPGDDTERLEVELDRRLPPARCRGGKLIVDPAVTVPPVTDP